MMVWLLAPLMLATKPTPQASCSLAGSYNPCAAGRIRGRAGSVTLAPLAANWLRTVVDQPTTFSGRTDDSTCGLLSLQALRASLQSSICGERQTQAVAEKARACCSGPSGTSARIEADRKSVV